MHKKSLFRLAATLFVFILLVGSIGAGTTQIQAAPATQTAPALFGDGNAADAPAGYSSKLAQTAAAIRSRYVTLNLALLSNPSEYAMGISPNKLTLNIFSDITLSVSPIAINTIYGYNGHTWVGRVDGNPWSEVLITVMEGGWIHGYISNGMQLFTLATAKPGLYSITQQDQNVFARMEQRPIAPPQIPAAYASKPMLSTKRLTEGDTGPTIDVFVVYSNDAKTAAGGVQAMEAEINTAIASANQAYSNSAITQRVRLVGTYNANYTSVNFDTDLSNLSGTSDGIMDEVHTFREYKKADLVAMFTNNTEFCGLGYLMTTVSTSFASSGFSVTSRQCISNMSFQHEMGHNEGAHHDVGSAGGQGAYSYSYGFVNPSNLFRTVMAYNVCGCPRVNWFSNPNVTYNGNAAGSANANNALTLNNTLPTVRDFRQSVTPKVDTLGVYRPSTNTFFLRNSNTSGFPDIAFIFGSGTNLYPVAGDWDGNGVDSVGVYDSSTGVFSLRNSNSAGAADYTLVLGNPNDTPFAGKWASDMTGDGVGVYRNSNGILYLKKTLATGFADYFAILGNPGDQGVAGDWDGNGLSSPGVYRSSNATFYMTNLVPSGVVTGDYAVVFGAGTELPVIGDWTGVNHSGVGLFRPSDGFNYLKNSLTNGISDINVYFGANGDRPIAGKWVAGPVPPMLDSKPSLNGVIVPGNSSGGNANPVEPGSGD